MEVISHGDPKVFVVLLDNALERYQSNGRQEICLGKDVEGTVWVRYGKVMHKYSGPPEALATQCETKKCSMFYRKATRAAQSGLSLTYSADSEHSVGEKRGALSDEEEVERAADSQFWEDSKKEWRGKCAVSQLSDDGDQVREARSGGLIPFIDDLNLEPIRRDDVIVVGKRCFSKTALTAWVEGFKNKTQQPSDPITRAPFSPEEMREMGFNDLNEFGFWRIGAGAISESSAQHARGNEQYSRENEQYSQENEQYAQVGAQRERVGEVSRDAGVRGEFADAVANYGRIPGNQGEIAALFAREPWLLQERHALVMAYKNALKNAQVRVIGILWDTPGIIPFGELSVPLLWTGRIDSGVETDVVLESMVEDPIVTMAQLLKIRNDMRTAGVLNRSRQIRDPSNTLQRLQRVVAREIRRRRIASRDVMGREMEVAHNSA